MDTLSQLWLDCLAGHLTGNTFEQLTRLSPTEAIRLTTLSKQQGLAALFYWRVQPFANRLPAELIEPLRRQYLWETIHSIQREKELKNVLTALNAANLQPIPFKGAALAHTVYPLPELRTMGDLDLWIDAKEMRDAIGALEQLGYVWREKEARPHTWQLEREGEIQLFG
ncbi:MAG: nucleotidyltransferase family protein, partial [Anaerolineales bacterium]|nr:nucleotidyltransferase family protein [Anaerolineales bacterium]